MLDNKKPEKEIMRMVQKTGMVRAREVRQAGFHPEYLRRLCEKGFLVRSGRGLYVSANPDVTELHDFAQAAKRVPHGVICLLSALAYHNIGTQNPYQIWIAVDRRARKPKVDFPPLRIFRFSGQALDMGVEEATVEGVKVRIYNPAKTVADCFKYRNKIGLDVALEALRESLRERKCNSDDLWHFAKVCRVANIMRPYMEAIV